MKVNKINNLSFEQKHESIPPHKIAEKLKKFYTYGRIAKEYNVTKDAVFRAVKNRIASSPEEDKSRIYKLYQNKYTIYEIKAMLGYPIRYIKQVIKQYENAPNSNPASNNLVNYIMDKFNIDSSVIKNLK